MTLIVEDGTGVAGAESYVGVAEMDDYSAKHGITAWPSGSTSAIIKQKEIALRRSAQYIDGHYGPEFPGRRGSSVQTLLWPRTGAALADGTPIPENSVPACIRNAQFEVAGLAVAGVELTVTTEAGPVLKRKKTDVLEKEWFEGTVDRAPVFGSVDAALSPLFGAETSGIITTAELGRV